MSEHDYGLRNAVLGGLRDRAAAPDMDPADLRTELNHPIAN